MTGTPPQLEEIELLANSADLEQLAQELGNIPDLINDTTAGAMNPFVTLLIGPDQQQYFVHTHVLLARSLYAKALLDSSFKEATEGTSTLRLPDHSLEGVKRVVQYMYSASFSVSACTVLQVLEAARYLMVSACEQRCADYIAEHLDNTSCISLLDTALHINSYPLQQAVLSYVGTHAQGLFKSIAIGKEYSTVSPIVLQVILQRSDLEVNEDEVLHFVESWLESRSKLEQDDAEQILGHISYPALSSRLLQRLQTGERPPQLPVEWLKEALACKEDVLLLSEIPTSRRLRVPTPVLMIYGRGWFKSRHPLELELLADAKQAGCTLDLQAASSCACVHDPKGLCDATASFHVEAWVNPCYLSRPYPHCGPILSKHSTGKGWELRMGRDGIEMMVTLRKGQVTWHELVACNHEVELGKWIHLAAQYDGTMLTLFVNGQAFRNRQPNWNNQGLQRDPCAATPVNDVYTPLTIGKNHHWQDRKLVCKVTGVRVVRDRLLQPGEFLKLVL